MYLLLACSLQKNPQEDLAKTLETLFDDTGESSTVEPDDTAVQNDTGFERECPPTIATEEGTYHRELPPIRNDLNIYGSSNPQITIRGFTQTTNCQPKRNMRIQIWHADEYGQYDTDSDEFKYYGEFISDGEGFYEFFTIYPGPEQTGSSQYKPVQIHIKLFEGEFEKLKSTIYFTDDPFLAFDENIPEENIITLQDDGNVLVGLFDLTF